MANIYSQDFAIKVKDPVNKVLYTQKWMKNMSVRAEPKVKAYAPTGAALAAPDASASACSTAGLAPGGSGLAPGSHVLAPREGE